MNISFPKSWILNLELSKFHPTDEILIIPFSHGPSIANYIYLCDINKGIIYAETMVKKIENNIIILFIVSKNSLSVQKLKEIGININFRSYELIELSVREQISIKTLIKSSLNNGLDKSCCRED